VMDKDEAMAAPAESEAAPAVKEEKMDPELAEWFKVDEEQVPGTPRWHEDDGNDDSVTEDDSDNEDVAGEPHQDGDLDDWMMVKPGDHGGDVQASSKASGKEPEKVETDVKIETDVKMGESEDAMEYDQESIFRHLCFYLDSPANANKNGIPVKPSKHEKDIANNFAKLAQLISENGGRVVDLDEPRLTHVIVDKRDESRRLELIKRTAKPKRRHLVVSEYIRACLDEGTLLDEDEFIP